MTDTHEHQGIEQDGRWVDPDFLAQQDRGAALSALWEAEDAASEAEALST